MFRAAIATKYRLWRLCMALLMVANLAYFWGNLASWIVTLGFFLFVPGYLLLSALNQKLESRWIVASFSLGLSILLLMMGGLALNSLHFIGLSQPLETLNIFIVFDAINILLLILNRKRYFELPRRITKSSRPQIVTAGLLTLLPLIAAGGAISLNNGSSNVFTLFLFVAIAALFIWLVIRDNMEPIYPYALLMFALSILLTISMRSWYIFGADVQQEFAVFQLTNAGGFWNISAFRDPYNACLSITILPTVLSKITNIPDLYIFKVVFQMISAFMLVPIYVIMRRLSTAKVALMGAFVYLSLPNFINEFSWANRQEIAYIFFALLLLTTFLSMTRKIKTLLTILFLLGLIVSHYSTNYVALAAIAISWIIYRLLLLYRKQPDQKVFELPTLRASIFIAALLVTILWNVQITGTAGGLLQTVGGTIAGVFDKSAPRSGDVSYSLLGNRTKSPQELLSDYASKNNLHVQYYSEPNMPLTAVGRSVSKTINVNSFNKISRSLIAKLLQVLLLIGVGITFFKFRKRATTYELYFLALALSFVVLLVLQTLLPQLSVSYGTQRLFQQSVMVLGVPIILGMLALLRLKAKYKFRVAAIFLALFFLHLSGFIPQMLGGYPPQLSLNNYGATYNAYYSHKTELMAADWLLANNKTNLLVAADYSALSRLQIIDLDRKTHNASPFDTIGPYYFEDNANLASRIYSINLENNIVEFTYIPTTQNKNLVYSNGGSSTYYLPSGR